MITGMDTGWPMTVVDRSRCAGRPATCGAKPSLLKALMLSPTVTPFSEPATSAPYTAGGSRFLARLSASATVSNQLLPILEVLSCGEATVARSLGRAPGPHGAAARP